MHDHEAHVRAVEAVGDVFGRTSPEKLWVDVHEEWLDPA